MKKLFLSIVTLALLSVCGVAHGETIRILSTNDMHSAIEKMPQLAAIVDSLRSIDPFLLVLSGGDNRTGNPYNDLYQPVSYPMVSMMNLIGFDASALGNHEYDSKVEGLAQVITLSISHTLPPTSVARLRREFKCFPINSLTLRGLKLAYLASHRWVLWASPTRAPKMSLG